jgi:hypothetical protein
LKSAGTECGNRLPHFLRPAKTRNKDELYFVISIKKIVYIVNNESRVSLSDAAAVQRRLIANGVARLFGQMLIAAAGNGSSPGASVLFE